MTPELIETSSDMEELLDRLNGSRLIAVDTEFFRETTYFPQLALVQLATENIVACVDPLAFDAKPALRKILHDKHITKIFHSCSQDMEVLFYYLGDTPVSIYDTQLANALLSEHHQVGYASLVESELGVQLDKSQTRTNWLQRPLTGKQIQYAGDDVFYLYQLHDILEKKLQESGRKSWFEEESLTLSSEQNCFQANTDKLWKRVKGASRLNKKNLVIVQYIAVWRERLAQDNDRTRRKILSDDVIIQLALSPPEKPETLDPFFDRRYSFSNEAKQALLDTIKTAQDSPVGSWPDNRFEALDSQQKSLLITLQQSVTEKAEELGISSAMLCSRKDLEKLILSDADSDDIEHQTRIKIIQGWRFDCIGKQLTETLKDAAEKCV